MKTIEKPGPDLEVLIESFKKDLPNPATTQQSAYTRQLTHRKKTLMLFAQLVKNQGGMNWTVSVI